MADEGSGRNPNDLVALLKALTPLQLDFIRERLQAKSDAEAARTVGVAPQTVSEWKASGVPIERVLALAKMDSVEVARENLRRLASEAVEAIRQELQGRRKLEAAREVLDRIGLEAGSKVDLMSGGQPLTSATTIIVREYLEDEQQAGD